MFGEVTFVNELYLDLVFIYFCCTGWFLNFLFNLEMFKNNLILFILAY